MLIGFSFTCHSAVFGGLRQILTSEQLSSYPLPIGVDNLLPDTARQSTHARHERPLRK